QCFNVGRTREHALGVLLHRSSALGQFDTVVVQTPEQGSNRHVQHGEFFTQHVLVLQQDWSQLRQVVADLLAGQLLCLGIRVAAVFQSVHVHKQFLFEVVQEQAFASAHGGVRRHQL